MDHCPKEHRGKMSSIETFFSATWCGSAMFGGYLIETMSLLNSFISTANLQLFAVSFNVFLYKYAYKGGFSQDKKIDNINEDKKDTSAKEKLIQKSE